VREAAGEFHPLDGQAEAGHAPRKRLARPGVVHRVGAQDQPGVGHPVQDAAPGEQHGRRDLGEVVEAAEGDRPARSAGKGETAGA
jgi:hypothetical protein